MLNIAIRIPFNAYFDHQGSHHQHPQDLLRVLDEALAPAVPRAEAWCCILEKMTCILLYCIWDDSVKIMINCDEIVINIYIYTHIVSIRFQVQVLSSKPTWEWASKAAWWMLKYLRWLWCKHRAQYDAETWQRLVLVDLFLFFCHPNTWVKLILPCEIFVLSCRKKLLLSIPKMRTRIKPQPNWKPVTWQRNAGTNTGNWDLPKNPKRNHHLLC